MEKTQEEKAAIRKANNDEQAEQAREWAAQRFGIPLDDVVWYHSGVCYDRILVRTVEARNKVTEKVKGRSVNGGMFHGMALGGASKHEKGYDIMC